MGPRKRDQISATPDAGNRRRSQRVVATGKQSTYFEGDGDESDELLPSHESAKRGYSGKSKLDLRDEDAFEEDDVDHEVDDDEAEGVHDEEEHAHAHASKKRGRGTPLVVSKTTAKKQRKPPPEDYEDEEDEDEDREPRETFISMPKLRDTGGVDYEDDRVHPNTLTFLKDLKANNVRSWLKARDPEYRRSLKDWESFVEALSEKIIEEDDTVPELPLKDIIFRIYRDIRFSKDSTPYKPHYSVAWSRTGRKGPYACYYLHLEPGKSFVGGGLWHPDNQALAKLRANIDERPHRIRRVLMSPGFRRTFFPGTKNDEKSVLAAFAKSNKENALKSRPQGFHPEHRDIELLKLRNFTVSAKLKDVDVMGEGALNRVMAIIAPMVAYVTFLNSVVMPDDNDDDDDENEDEDEDGND